MWKEILYKIGLDLLCVSIHYSNRYGNADNYVNTKADEDLKQYVFYLKNSTTETIVNKFMNDRLQHSTTMNTKIEWKNIHFIWKQFCSDMFLPNMIYSNTLKGMIKELKKDDYNEKEDCLMNYTSKYLPIESDFIHFWENTMTSCFINEEAGIATTTWDELEIEELSMLFKYWVKTNNQSQTQPQNSVILSNGNISEENILKILNHFFPNTTILENKYVIGISCILWNKSNDILNSLGFIKQQIEKQNNMSLISFSDAYNYYVKYTSSNQNQKFIVSKLYFEKYLKMKMHENIVHENFIDANWLNKI
jgi:hypothetical protein